MLNKKLEDVLHGVGTSKLRTLLKWVSEKQSYEEIDFLLKKTLGEVREEMLAAEHPRRLNESQPADGTFPAPALVFATGLLFLILALFVTPLRCCKACKASPDQFDESVELDLEAQWPH